MQVKLRKPGLWHLCLVLYGDDSVWWLQGKQNREEGERRGKREHHH
jgi:hypothetical protein